VLLLAAPDDVVFPNGSYVYCVTMFPEESASPSTLPSASVIGAYEPDYQRMFVQRMCILSRAAKMFFSIEDI
jgi:hypothetical protein